MDARWSLFVVLSLTWAASFVRGTCQPWDDTVDFVVLEPIREEVKKLSMEYYKVADHLSESFYGVGLQADNIVAGNLSDIKLCYPEAGQSATTFCDESGNTTLRMSVGIEDLHVAFDYLKIVLPIIPNIGDTSARLSVEGNCVTISVSILTTADLSTCSVASNYFQIHSLGSLGVTFQDGLYNKALGTIVTKMFNFVYGRMESQLNSAIESQFQRFVSKLIEGAGEKICKMFPQ